MRMLGTAFTLAHMEGVIVDSGFESCRETLLILPIFQCELDTQHLLSMRNASLQKERLAKRCGRTRAIQRKAELTNTSVICHIHLHSHLNVIPMGHLRFVNRNLHKFQVCIIWSSGASLDHLTEVNGIKIHLGDSIGESLRTHSRAHQFT